MRIIYQLVLFLYTIGIRIASIFHPKAKLWVKGRVNVFEEMRLSLKSGEQRIWFHYASLGEFEQGRPVQEAIKIAFPNHKIVMTFFSPSGYEARKNHGAADYVFYLPMDGANRSKKTIELINPSQVYFTKYEFWYFYFKILAEKKIPLFLISGIFRKEQMFFKWYGSFYRSILNCVSYFFVQNETSEKLLHGIGLKNVLVTGDTRFDRVAANAKKQTPNAIVAQFAKDQSIFLAGSSWPADEKLIASLCATTKFKFILAPHEIKESNIQSIISLFPATCIRYSEANLLNINAARVLIIDNIGMLSSLYQYASIAYIGGGFGAGIHNTLEAAAFGKPVIFGPKYHKFEEAKSLIALGAAKSISDESTLKLAIATLFDNESNYQAACEKSAAFIGASKGATEKIMQEIIRY